MKTIFASDESAPGPVVRALRSAGLEVSAPQLGVDDVSVLEAAFAADAVILTRDKDFAKLVLHDRHPCHGLVILRFPGEGTWAAKAPAIVAAIYAIGDGIRGNVNVLDSAGVTQTPIP